MYTRSNFTQHDVRSNHERQVQQAPARNLVFTHLDLTVKRFTVPQAYRQAGDVYKALRHLEPDAVVFPRDTFDSSDKSLSLTLAEFSDKVESILRNMFKYN